MTNNGLGDLSASVRHVEVGKCCHGDVCITYTDIIITVDV